MTKPEQAPDDGMVQRNGPRLPMHRLTPAEHAALGWAHGQYHEGGYCFALMLDDDPAAVEAFRKEAAERGAKYIALRNLPEYTG